MGNAVTGSERVAGRHLRSNSFRNGTGEGKALEEKRRRKERKGSPSLPVRSLHDVMHLQHVVKWPQCTDSNSWLVLLLAL